MAVAANVASAKMAGDVCLDNVNAYPIAAAKIVVAMAAEASAALVASMRLARK